MAINILGSPISPKKYKKFAGGSAVSSSTQQGFPFFDGSYLNTTNEYYITVNGLIFLPSVILIYADNDVLCETIYNADWISNSSYSDLHIVGTFLSNAYFQASSPVSVTSNGFTLPVVRQSKTYKWKAFA
jgi:hypothetical protein